jgi:hypothetical protein
MERTFDWVNPPPRWSGDAAALEIETAEGGDWWRDTFYGYAFETGHAWVAPVAGDFSLSARVRGDYAALYDQAGLMLLGADGAWAKAGVEFTDGAMHMSVVVSVPRSDWSQLRLDGAGRETEVAVRLTRHDDALRVQFATGDGPWRMARLAPFPAGPARAGVMACSPRRAGFRARLSDVAIGPPIPRELHPD